MSPANSNTALQLVTSAYVAFPDGIAVIGADGRVLYCNPAMLRLTGRDEADAFVGQTPSEAWGESEGYQTGAEQGEESEFVLFRADGGRREVSVRSARMEMDRAAVWVSIYRDITARRKAERTMQETNLQFQQLTANMSEVLWLSSQDQSRWEYISPAFEKIWGREASDIEGSLGLPTVHPDDRLSFIQTFRDILGRDRVELDYRIIRPDGTIRWVRTRAFPIRDQNGSAIRIGGTSEDITDRRAADQAMKDAERRKEQFYRFLVHDLNKPLATIVGFSSQLSTDRALPETLRPLAERISSASVRLRGIVAHTLEIQNIERGDVSLRIKNVDLWAVVGEVASYLDDKDLDHEIRIGGKTPTEARQFPPLMVQTDPICIGRVLQNLMDNALKYGQTRVELEVTPGAERVEITVWNDGPPIPDDLRERVFSEYFRAAAPRRDSSGIGLAAVRKLVMLLGGKVWAESPDRGGTAFIVQLPTRVKTETPIATV